MSISQSLLANNHTSPLIGVILTTLLCASPVSIVTVSLTLVVEEKLVKGLLVSERHNYSFHSFMDHSGEYHFPLQRILIGQVAVVLKAQGAQLIIPVALLHAAAFALGYWCSRLSSFGESTSRTISIECGMQSSALGFLLAQKHFTNPLVAVPSAVSVVFMAV
ncbi:unnamed protein product [Musa acuminata subsp. burmannicoides]